MQTFLPYPEFVFSAKCLDYKRLGKQRIEARDIHYLCYKKKDFNIKAKDFDISEASAELLWKRYRNHPAVLMWEGYENALAFYYNIMRAEWINRGYQNNMPRLYCYHITDPPWLGDKDFHASHRSNLLRKNPEYYSQFGWPEKDNLPYIWPVRKENKK